MTARLEAIPAGLFSTEFDVRENDASIGRVRYRPLALRKQGTVTTAGRALAVSREGVLRADYLLSAADGSVRARAEKQGFARESYRVTFGGSEVFLKKKVFALRETFVLSDGSGEIGLIRRESLLSRRMTVELAASAAGMAREIVLFLIWVSLMIHRRDAAASAE